MSWRLMVANGNISNLQTCYSRFCRTKTNRICESCKQPYCNEHGVQAYCSDCSQKIAEPFLVKPINPRSQDIDWRAIEKPSSINTSDGNGIWIIAGLIGIGIFIWIGKSYGFGKVMALGLLFWGSVAFLIDSPKTTGTISSKERGVALLLCLLLGTSGVHRFYVGKMSSGLFYILAAFITGWHLAASHNYDYEWGILDGLLLGFIVVSEFVDFILILIGKSTDSQGAALLRWGNKY